MHMISLAVFYWDPQPELFRLPIVHWPILWYGVLFALGFILGFPIFVSLLTRFLGPGQKRTATQIADRLTIYMILGTVIGARLGHFLFYERPSAYLTRPWELFCTWQGGLASHGALIGILIALFLFNRRLSLPNLTWIRLLDFIAVPTALAACCIRIGNFVNQEILGTPTTLPWAVIFGHPADHSFPTPRHPVQLYEALFYLLTFLLLYRLSFKSSFLRAEGKLVGLFLILTFGFRFLVEFLKVEQSHVWNSSLTMGQLLSLPAILLGLVFYWRAGKK